LDPEDGEGEGDMDFYEEMKQAALTNPIFLTGNQIRQMFKDKAIQDTAKQK